MAVRADWGRSGADSSCFAEIGALGRLDILSRGPSPRRKDPDVLGKLSRVCETASPEFGPCSHGIGNLGTLAEKAGGFGICKEGVASMSAARLPLPGQWHEEAGYMSEQAGNGPTRGENTARNSEDPRRNRSIRFSDSEWEEVRRAAEVRGTPPAELVRETVLAQLRNRECGDADTVLRSLAPLIERTFRYSWFLATERRDAMIAEGREDKVDALVAGGRALHDKLRRGGDG